MKTRIVTDSSVDINKELFGNEENMERVPFKIIIEDEEIIDRNIDLSALKEKMKATKNRIATACPSPHDFLETFKKSKENFVVTISEKLRGSSSKA